MKNNGRSFGYVGLIERNNEMNNGGLNWPMLYSGLELMNQIDILTEFIVDNNAKVSFKESYSGSICVECTNSENNEDHYDPILNTEFADYFKRSLRKAKVSRLNAS